MPDTPAIITEPTQQDAYALLSKPTKDLTDAEVTAIIVNLRQRRITSLTTGKPDRPVKEAKEKKAKPTADEKARNTAMLLAQLKLPGAE